MELPKATVRKRGRAEKEEECRPAARPCGENDAYGENDEQRPLGMLRLCAPRASSANRIAWRQSFSLLFEGAPSASRARAESAGAEQAASAGRSGVEHGAHGRAAFWDQASTHKEECCLPSKALLLGPAHFPLNEIASALVRLTRPTSPLLVHTASALPLAQHSTLTGEELRKDRNL
jgi:hypothetical protein